MPEISFLLASLLFIAGMTVWILAERRAARGEAVLEAMPTRNGEWGAAVVVATLFFVSFQLASRVATELSLLDHNAERTALTVGGVQATVLFNAMLIGVMIFFLTEAGRKPVASFGLHLDCPHADLRVGGLGYLASFPPVLAVALLTVPLKSEERTHGFVTLLRDDPTFAAYAWVAVAAIIAAPLLEELIFRVILQGWLRSKLPALPAIAISSVCFSAVHGFPDSLALLPLALILGYVFEKRRSYLAVVVLHALFNAQALAAVLLLAARQN